jgi:AcrR family transcriptional regulator
MVVPVAVQAPKQDRSRATRARIVEAAAACLVDLGYAGASTTAVARRAEVSQGSLFKHFPSKAQLLGATVTEILAGFVVDFRRDVDEALARAPRLEPAAVVQTAVGALWRIFRQPSMRAVFELYVAARTDPALETELGPIIDRHRGAILAEAHRLFPDATGAARPEFDGAVEAVVFAMQGAALGLFSPDPAAEVGHLAFLERLALRELARAGGGGR